MNKIKKIFWTLYLWQLPIICIALILGQFFHYPKWTLFLPLVWIFVVGIISNISFLSFLRFLTWPFHRNQVILTIKKFDNNLFGYPMLLWVELCGWEAYKKGGYIYFVNEMNNQLDKTKDNLIKMFDKTKDVNRELK